MVVIGAGAAGVDEERHLRRSGERAAPCRAKRNSRARSAPLHGKEQRRPRANADCCSRAEVQRTHTRDTFVGVKRRLLGALTLWPPLYLVLFLVVILIATVQGDGDPDDAGFLIPFSVLMGLHIGTMLLIIALLIVYIRDAYSNPRIDDNKRTFWAIVLFMGNMIAMPIYWWVYLRREPDRLATQPDSSTPA